MLFPRQRTQRIRRRHGLGWRSRVRSRCRFGNRGAEYVSGSGIKLMGGGAERQYARALADEHQGMVKLDLKTLPFRVRLLHRTRLYFQPRRRH